MRTVTARGSRRGNSDDFLDDIRRWVELLDLLDVREIWELGTLGGLTPRIL